MHKRRGLVWFVALILMGGCSSPSQQTPRPAGAENQEVSVMQISSPAFQTGESIPARFTCDGEDRSPALTWSGVPAGAKSLVLVCDDPDAPMGIWIHWIVANIPPAAIGIPENGPLPEGAVEIKNSFGRTSYGGPCPPSGTHRYYFRLYALDAERIEGLSLNNYRSLLPSHALAQAEWMGTYRRK